MSAPLLSELREPPVVGRFYMVPSVHFNWCNVVTYWPVLGPLHEDARFFNFANPHYHIDARFVTARLARRVTFSAETVEGQAQRSPLSKRSDENVDIPRHRPSLRRFRCRRADFPYEHGSQPRVGALRSHFGDDGTTAPDAIRLADGRLLCPLRKVDLSQFTPDENGFVTCPLHGLRVRCLVPAMVCVIKEAGEIRG